MNPSNALKMKKVFLNLDLKLAPSHAQRVTRLYRNLIKTSFTYYGYCDAYYEAIDIIREDFKKKKNLRVTKQIKYEIKHAEELLKLFSPPEPLIRKHKIPPHIKKNKTIYKNHFILSHSRLN